MSDFFKEFSDLLNAYDAASDLCHSHHDSGSGRAGQDKARLRAKIFTQVAKYGGRKTAEGFAESTHWEHDAIEIAKQYHEHMTKKQNIKLLCVLMFLRGLQGNTGISETMQAHVKEQGDVIDKIIKGHSK